MASTNIKLFDENKGNMSNDTEYNSDAQRLNGVQTGIASSKLQNKTLYQLTLVAYAIAQLMVANNVNANDSDSVSTFVANLSSVIVQPKDKASTTDVTTGTNDTKYITPAGFAAGITNGFASQAQANAGTETAKYISPKTFYDAITNRMASNSEVDSGTNTTKLVNPATLARRINTRQVKYTTLSLTLSASSWNANAQQTVTASGVTSSNLIEVAPAVASIQEYANCGVHCISQASNSLTFECYSIPNNALTVNIVIWG